MVAGKVAVCIRQGGGGYAVPHTKNFDPEKFTQFSANAHDSNPFKVIFTVTG
jgi:hypothetical protein